MNPLSAQHDYRRFYLAIIIYLLFIYYFFIRRIILDMLLDMKCVLKHQDLNTFCLKSNNMSTFHYYYLWGPGARDNMKCVKI